MCRLQFSHLKLTNQLLSAHLSDHDSDADHCPGDAPAVIIGLYFRAVRMFAAGTYAQRVLSAVVCPLSSLRDEAPASNRATQKWSHMQCKANDWIEHRAFGLGRVSEDRGDRLDIQFINSGTKTILKTAEFRPALSPPDFKFPKAEGKSRTPRFKVERPPRRPPLDFDHLVEGFVRFFDGGAFDSTDFDGKEREKKRETAKMLNDKLGKEIFESLLRDGRYDEVCDIGRKVLQKTKLVYRIEKAKFADGLKIPANHAPFANALFDLLHGSTEMEQRFTKFCDFLSDMGANEWTVATYYQFLATDGKLMFMKPSIMKRMADSLKIALNYKPEPNWRTYSKLQELADRVKLELQNRKLNPRSGTDVQGFIWASINIADGTYGKKGSPQESDNVDE